MSYVYKHDSFVWKGHGLCIYITRDSFVRVQCRTCNIGVYVSMCLCVYVSMCLCVYVSMCLCVYVSMCLCVYVVNRTCPCEKGTVYVYMWRMYIWKRHGVCIYVAYIYMKKARRMYICGVCIYVRDVSPSCVWHVITSQTSIRSALCVEMKHVTRMNEACHMYVLGIGVATISRLLKIIGLFCRISSFL